MYEQEDDSVKIEMEWQEYFITIGEEIMKEKNHKIGQQITWREILDRDQDKNE